ncbi:MAG: hypothetical protein J7M16_04155 [Anaerolineae bacterium]|nr:hypothetical protein [Anaerolineae bacterium]
MVCLLTVIHRDRALQSPCRRTLIAIFRWRIARRLPHFPNGEEDGDLDEVARRV